MISRSQSRWRILWVLPPIGIGILVLALFVSGKSAPVLADNPETARSVRVIAVPRVALVPRAVGYGSVQPAQVWTAVSQVAGRIIHVHPQLHDGEIITAGTELLRIDPVDYELSLAQARAELAELEVQEKNARASLAIEERNLALAEREQQRIAELSRQGSVSQSDRDSAERTTLNSRAAMQNLRNTLALLPTQRQVLAARISQAERDLEHTRIIAPFNMRVANLAVEVEQYVGKGQSMFQGDATDRVEIVAQVNMGALRKLFVGFDGLPPDLDSLAANLPGMTGLTAQVRLDMGSHIASWDAQFVRFSDHVDTRTRTLGVVVAVDRPLQKIRPGYRPPLSKGMLVQAVLHGRVQADRIVVPRAAVRAGRVHLVDADSRLQIREVEVLYNLDDISVIASGIEAGERLVVSDVVPAVAGMLLHPVEDPAVARMLVETAGEGR